MKKLALFATIAALSLSACTAPQKEVSAQKPDAAVEHQAVEHQLSATTHQGTVKGYDTPLFSVNLKAGESVRVSISKGDVYAKLYAPNNKPGESDPVADQNEWYTAKTSGSYTVQVFQTRNAARNNRNEAFTLKVEHGTK